MRLLPEALLLSLVPEREVEGDQSLDLRPSSQPARLARRQVVALRRSLGVFVEEDRLDEQEVRPRREGDDFPGVFLVIGRIENEGVEVDVQIESAAEALDEVDGERSSEPRSQPPRGRPGNFLRILKEKP